jgi:hypothetical protein
MLVAARDKDAFKTLQTALAIMEQEMMTGPDKSDSTNSTSSSTTSTRRRSSLTSIETTVFEKTEEDSSCGSLALTSSSAARFHIDTKCSTAIPELKDDRYFIFNQALLVATRGNSSSTSEPTSMAKNHDDDNNVSPAYSHSLVCFYASVVIYNLALAYHKKGMVAAAFSSSSSSATSPSCSITTFAMGNAESSCLALSQSLRLYEHSLKVIRSIADYSEDCKLLLYAVSCNLAHLYCRKGERSRAQELLDGLEEANLLSYHNLLG